MCHSEINSLRRNFFDSEEDRVCIFYSDAEQSLIDSLEFVGSIKELKNTLIGWGYKFFEIHGN